MRNSRVLAAGWSVRRISRSMVSDAGGNWRARACRSKVDVCIAVRRPLIHCRARPQGTHYHKAMQVLSAAEMQECDRATTERFGIPSIELMRNAAAAVVRVAREAFPEARRVTVL